MRIGRHSTLSSRAIIGFIVALLIFMQGLTAYVSSSAPVRHGKSEVGAIASSLREFCRADAIGYGAPPAHDRRVCLECCIICGVRDCGVSSTFDAARAPDAQFPVSLASASSAPRFIDGDGRPTGWASSWSSRAPPSIS